MPGQQTIYMGLTANLGGLINFLSHSDDVLVAMQLDLVANHDAMMQLGSNESRISNNPKHA